MLKIATCTGDAPRPPYSLGPVDADPAVGRELGLPRAAELDLLGDGLEAGGHLDVRGEPRPHLLRERLLLGGEREIHGLAGVRHLTWVSDVGLVARRQVRSALMSVDLAGAADLHCHFGPDPHRARSVDAFEAAREAAAAGHRAIVLKSHDSPTASLAWAVQRDVGDAISVFGGICCDREVGGMNPAAVEVALGLGARIVWLPTLSSRQDFENGVAAQLGIPGPGHRRDRRRRRAPPRDARRCSRSCASTTRSSRPGT